MSERNQVQANPVLDKVSARLSLAGAGEVGAILKGLGATIKITLEKDEILGYVKIFSHGPNQFSNDLTASGSFSSLSGGRQLWSCPIVYGVDTDYGLSGGKAVRNFLEWSIKRKNTPNPSGPIVGEKAYSFEDETAMKGLDDNALRKDRSWFSERDYYEAVDDTIFMTDAPEVSGATWREDNSTVYFVSDNLAIIVTDREGTILQDLIDLPGALGFNDTEAIQYLGSDRFAILDEGVFGSRPPHLILFHLKQGASELTAKDIKIYTLSKVDEFAGGYGAEGLAYNRATGIFYVGTQPTGDGQGGLWEIDIHNKDTDGEPTQTLLYKWYDILVEPGHLGSGALLGDLFFGREMGSGSVNSSIFCHFRTPNAGGPSDQQQVIQIDIEDGQFLSAFNHGLSGQWEAMTFDPERQSIFFARETTGGFYRFDHDDFDDVDVFRRQFYVKDVPLREGIYMAGQEAQLGEAWVFVSKNINEQNVKDATFGISILPTFNDEFFGQHEYKGNRYRTTATYWLAGVLKTTRGQRPANRFAQTIRNVGGAKTVEIFYDSVSADPVIPERGIEDLDGCYLENPSYGLHLVTARLRAEWGSSHYVNIVGYIRFLQLPCID